MVVSDGIANDTNNESVNNEVQAELSESQSQTQKEDHLKSSFQELRAKWERFSNSPSTPSSPKPPPVPPRRVGDFSPGLESKIKLYQELGYVTSSSLKRNSESFSPSSAIVTERRQSLERHLSLENIQDGTDKVNTKKTQPIIINDNKRISVKFEEGTKPIPVRSRVKSIIENSSENYTASIGSYKSTTSDLSDTQPSSHMNESFDERNDELSNTSLDQYEEVSTSDSEDGDGEGQVPIDEGISVYDEVVDPKLIAENEKLNRFSLYKIDLIKDLEFEDLRLDKTPVEVLCPRFSVFKFNSKQQVFSKKTRLWEIDMLTGELRNMDQKRSLKKIHHVDNIMMLEKRVKDQNKIRITLSNSNVYELVFKSTKERELFFQCVTLLRKNTIVWAPDLFNLDVGTINNSSLLNLKNQENFTDSTDSTDTSINTMISRIRASYQHIPYKHNGQSIDTNSEGVLNICTKKIKEDNIVVFTGTWNMANLPPPDVEIMRNWIPEGYDIYAIALQESDTRMDIPSYVQMFKNILGEGYFSVGYSSLWAIRLFVFAKDIHLSKISCVEVKQKPTGFLQICGNKGGIGLSMKFNETSMCFISSHLAAKEENFDRRNGDIYGISGKIALGIKALDITQFNHVFWCGDLNYRLDLPYNEAVSLAQEGNFEELLETDQLRKQLNQGHIFNEFNEGKISFKPTYKYKEGTSEYAQEKYRPPSYCDRILWISHPGCNASLLEYTSAPKIETSDHKPVRAIFSVETQLPFVDYFSFPPQSNKKIIFSGLYLSGRSGNLIKKPQLSFYSEILEKNPVHSLAKSVKAKLVNPAFSDEAIPELIPICSNSEFLKSQRIVISIREANKKKKNDDDEYIGQCIVSLANALEDSPSKFKVPVSVYTKRIGYLIGYVQIVNL